jgi:hypothetical protein
MEYFVGFLVSLLSLFVFNKILKTTTNVKISIPTLTQTRKVELLKKYLLSIVAPEEQTETQSRKHLKKNSMKAFFWEDNVYWIEDGFLITAKIVNNQIDNNTKKKVDTHSLNKVELDKMIFIVDKLTEGRKNDSSDSGK